MPYQRCFRRCGCWISCVSDTTDAISTVRHYRCRISGVSDTTDVESAVSQTLRMPYQQCLTHQRCRISGVSDITDAISAVSQTLRMPDLAVSQTTRMLYQCSDTQILYKENRKMLFRAQKNKGIMFRHYRRCISGVSDTTDAESAVSETLWMPYQQSDTTNAVSAVSQTLRMPNQRCLRHYRSCISGQAPQMSYLRCLRHYKCRISSVSDITDAKSAVSQTLRMPY
jgi:hypothetical protein